MNTRIGNAHPGLLAIVILSLFAVVVLTVILFYSDARAPVYISLTLLVGTVLICRQFPAVRTITRVYWKRTILFDMLLTAMVVYLMRPELEGMWRLAAVRSVFYTIAVQVSVVAIASWLMARDAVLPLVAVTFAFFGLKVLLAMCGWEYFRSDSAPQILAASDYDSSDGVQSQELNNQLNRLLSREAILSYAFAGNIPTGDLITFKAYEAVELENSKRATGKIDVRANENLIESLKSKRDEFISTSAQVQASYNSLYAWLLFCEMFLSLSYGIHLSIFVLCTYCIWQALPARGQTKLGSAGVESDILAAKESGKIERVISCRDAIPQLGFIGTLVGLSLAIVELGKVDAVQRVLERPGISPALAANLGVAFNTTLIALLASLSLSVSYSWLSARHTYCRRFVESVRD